MYLSKLYRWEQQQLAVSQRRGISDIERNRNTLRHSAYCLLGLVQNKDGKVVSWAQQKTFELEKQKSKLLVMESWELRKLQEDFSITGYVSLNCFYGLLDIEETEAGEVLGWTMDQMILDPDYRTGNDFCYEDALTELAIYTHKIDDNNYIIRYVVLPIGSIAGIGPCNY